MKQLFRYFSNFCLSLGSSFGLLYLLLSLSHILLSLSIENSSLQSDIVLWKSRWLLAAREVLLLAIPCLIAGLVIECTYRLLRAWQECNILKYALLTSMLLLSAALVMLYLGDWYTLLAMGQFASVEGLLLWLGNPLQIIQHLAHMEPLIAISLPLLGIGLGIALVALLLQIKQSKVLVQASLFFAALLLFLVSAFFVVINGSNWPLLHDRQLKKQDRIIATAADLYSVLRDQRTGPMSRIFADLKETKKIPDLNKLSSQGLQVQWHKQIQMHEYQQLVKRESLRPYNVLFILIESLRPDQLMSFGGIRPVMDTVDKLARNGRCFINTYTQASHSNYADICPISSQYPLRSKRYHLYPKNPPYPRVPIYDLLASVGYRTAIVSSQNEDWGQMSNYLNTPGLGYFLHAATFSGPTYVPRADHGFARFVKGEKRSGKIDDRLTVAEAIRWISEEPARPFYIYMNLQNSHVPYEIPSDFPRRYSPAKLDFPIRFGQFPKDRVAIVKDVYADSLGYVDAQICKLIDFLKAQRLFDNTLIIISADTGQAFFEHQFAGHANQVFDELMRVPLIFHGPGASSGTDERPAQHIDVPPSILALLGLPSHPAFQGENLFGQEFNLERPRFLLAQTPLAYQYAIVQSGYKLIYDKRLKTSKLFDLHRDPGERRDISKKDEPRTQELLGQLMKWKQEQLSYYEDLLLQKRFYAPRFSQISRDNSSLK